MGADYPLYGREPHASTNSLSRKERIKNPCLDLLSHATSRIANFQSQPTCGQWFRPLAGGWFCLGANLL